MAVNTAAALVQDGYRVLLIDMDPQGNSTFILHEIEDEDPGLLPVLLEQGSAPLEGVIIDTPSGISLAPANIQLAEAELLLTNMMGREQALKRKLTLTVLRSYDFILVDTPPSLGLLTVNALNIADYVIIPVACDYLSLVGLKQLFRTVEMCQENLGSTLEILGIAANNFHRSHKISGETLDLLRETYPTLVFQSVIGTNVRISEAPARHQTILEYDPDSTGAQHYQALAREIVERIKGNRDGQANQEV
jgi:chromosome partitioning protein